MKDKNYKCLTLSASHLQAIGEVASEWSAFEFSFQSAISMISNVPMPTVIAFTAPTPMYVWIDILENLMYLDGSPTNESLLKELKTVFERIRKAQTKRNAIVHAVWCKQFESDLGKAYLEKGDKAHGIGFPKKIKNGLINQLAYTSDEMKAVANEIRQLNEKFRLIFWPEKVSSNNTE
jgi:hypothetical protein